MFVEAVTGAVVNKIWDERKLVASFMTDFAELLLKGRLKIFVFGCSGTGKSTFGKILGGSQETSELTGTYDLSVDQELYGLENKRFAQILVPPGQEKFRARYWGKLFNAMHNSRRAIVVNIVCWGFHSLENVELHRVPEFRSDASDAARHQFLFNNRENELAATQTVTDSLCHYQHSLHMVTLVTKQDLWWHNRYDVQQHYTQAAYQSYIKRIEEAKGTSNFTHHFCSVSFGQINFRTKDGHVLFGTASGYDNSLLNANLGEFLALLRQIAN